MLYNYSEILKLYKNDYNLLNAIKSKKYLKLSVAYTQTREIIIISMNYC